MLFKYPFLTSTMKCQPWMFLLNEDPALLRLKAALRVVALSFKRPKVVDFLMEIRCVPAYS